VDEKSQVVRLQLWVYFEWIDCKLKWNPSHFNNVTYLGVPSSDVWLPDMTLFEGVSDEGNMPDQENFRAEIKFTGQVQYSFQSTVTIVSKLNVEFFPFDNQVCTLTFGSWMYSGRHIDLTVKGQDVSLDVSDLILHNEWEILDVKEVKNVVYYDCCSDPYPDITIYIYMKRKPLFYFVTIILPSVLVNILTIVPFVLPPFSGEKVSLQVTILLSITVFLLLVQRKLPSASEHFPTMVIYLANSMGLVCISCLLSSVVSHIYYRSQENKDKSRLYRLGNKVWQNMAMKAQNEAEPQRLSYGLNKIFMWAYICLTAANSFYFGFSLIFHNDGSDIFRDS
jgi:hypothetical protein